MSGPLVSTEWLEARLDDPSVVVLEVSADPRDDAAYFESHVPGSHYVFWEDLAWHDTDRQFPTPEVMAQRLGQLGVGDDTTVALVGDPIQFAAYVYWVMTMTGQESRARLVDGGRATWVAENRPLAREIPQMRPATLSVGKADDSSRVGRDDVLGGLGDPERVLVDMRSPEEYTGQRTSPPFYKVDHGAQRKGRIPGAAHLYYEDLLEPDGTLLAEPKLRERFESVGASPNREIVTYCRLSHRASLGWFVLTRLLGYPDVAVYDGSWTEWGSIVGFPVER